MIKYIHMRYHHHGKTETIHGKQRFHLLPKGGVTIAYYVDGLKKVVRFAIAECNPEDHFSKRIGRIKAAGKLLTAKNVDQIPWNGENNSAVVNRLRDIYYGYKEQFHNHPKHPVNIQEIY